MWGLRFRANLGFGVQIQSKIQGFDPIEGLGLISNLSVTA